ncbi:MAG: hypothetical protein PHD65_10220 [Gallionella sp.]|nr:hypothetical protein [Gallionella sp.]
MRLHILLFVSLITSSALANPNAYLGGSMIGQLNGKNFAVEKFSSGKFQVLILEVAEAKDDKGNIYWRNLDVLLVPYSGNTNVIFGLDACMLDGKVDPELIGVYNWPKVKVWRANRSIGKFEPLQAQNIDCSRNDAPTDE